MARGASSMTSDKTDIRVTASDTVHRAMAGHACEGICTNVPSELSQVRSASAVKTLAAASILTRISHLHQAEDVHLPSEALRRQLAQPGHAVQQPHLRRHSPL